jgi:hypothetical protein
MPNLLPIGGSTFAEDPEQSCALILPMWSAVFDPYVLRARAERLVRSNANPFVACDEGARVLRGADVEYVMLETSGRPIRLNIFAGTVLAGPVGLCFEVADNKRLPAQLDALQAYRSNSGDRPSYDRLARRLLALQAVDARLMGASLREIAAELFGPGEWPGRGDDRRSHMRRLLATGVRMIREGPRTILNLP